MDIVGRPFLPQIYKEDSQRLVVQKCVQVGISEWLIVKLISKLYNGWSILYSLPTENLRNTFVANRIDTLLKTVPFYQHGVKTAKGESDQVSLKHLWQGTVWFVGSNSKVGYVERPADMVIVDELDTSNIKNLELAPDRLKASKHKYYWEVGNPTIPKFGINKSYLNSDQKVWKIKCPACNRWQALDFFKNVVRQVEENVWELIDSNHGVVCKKCNSLLDRLSDGEWVAKYPGRSVSGYHISQLFSPTVTIKEIYDQFLKGQTDATAMQVFYNSYLGQPYEGVGAKITETILESKCMDDYTMPGNADACTAGVDVNYPQLNVRISDYPETGIRRAVYIGIVYSFAELSNLFKRYNVEYAVIDVAPERHKIAEFQAQHPFVWACQYSSTEVPEFWRVNEDDMRLTVDRTQSIDYMVSEILNGRNRLPKNFKSIVNYVDEMEAPTRILDETKNPPRYIWDEGGNADHFFHAENYDCLAMRVKDLIGDRMPEIIKICG